MATVTPRSDRGEADRHRFRCSKFYYTFGPREAALVVESPTSLRIVCPDSDNLWCDGVELTQEERVQEPGVAEANPVAGPIHLIGAEVGDAIAVAIDKISIDGQWGRTLLAPDHGFLRKEVLAANADEVPTRMYRWEIDQGDGVARLANPFGRQPICVPLAPFIGCIGVAPAGEGRVSTLLSGRHGGNMDLPLLNAGATVYLPVFCVGGNVALGDLHAAQGEGEIIGGGIEVSGTVDCTLRLVKKIEVEAPRIISGGSLFTVATSADMAEALAHGYGRLVGWLVELGMDRWDAYNLVSQAGSTMLGNLVSGTCTAAAGIKKALLPAAAAARLEAIYGA